MKIKNLKVYDKCLIIVDMVKGFVDEGVLHDERIRDVVPRQIELIENCNKNGYLIIFVKDAHDHDSVEFKRFGNTKHCLKGESESEVIDLLRPYENLENAVSVEKNSTSFMESVAFRNLMEEASNIKRFEIVGCCSDICIANGAIGLSNYLDERNKDYEILVHEDGIETYDSANHDRKEYSDAAKLLMRQQGIKLVKKLER